MKLREVIAKAFTKKVAEVTDLAVMKALIKSEIWKSAKLESQKNQLTKGDTDAQI